MTELAGYADIQHKSATRWYGFVCFFGMLFLPTTYQLERGFLVGLLCITAVYKIARNHGRISVSPVIINLTIVYVMVGLAYAIWGEARGNPGAIRSLTVFAIWPIVYLLLISITRRVFVFGLIKTMVVRSEEHTS